MMYICITMTDGGCFAGEISHPNLEAFNANVDNNKRVKILNPAVLMLGRSPVIGPNGEYYAAVDGSVLDAKTAAQIGADNLKLRFTPKITALGRSEMWFRCAEIRDTATLSEIEEKSYKKAVREATVDNSSLVIGVPTPKAG